MSAKYAIKLSPSTLPTTAMTTPDFFSNRTPFYTNPKERNFLQEVLSANQSILGTSLFVVIYVGIVLGAHSSLSMMRPGGDGPPVAVEFSVCMILPIMLFGNVFGFSVHWCTTGMTGTKVGAITWTYSIGKKFLLGVQLVNKLKGTTVIFVPFMILAYIPEISVVTFYNLELPAMIVLIIFQHFLFEKPCNEFLLKEGIIDSAEATTLRNSAVRRVSEVALTIVVHPNTTSSDEKKSYSSIKTIFGLLTGVLIFLAYPFTMITLFRSLGVGGRMAIVLLFHPLLMEFLMHGKRARVGKQTNLLGDEVKIEPMRDFMATFTLESYLVLIRRIMLCNLGSFQATTIAIIVTGIEETAVRSTIEVSDKQSGPKL